MTEDITLLTGDCIDVLAAMDADSVDAIVTDPPYGISFMGKQWDQPGAFGSRSRRGGGPNLRRGDADAALNVGTYDLSPRAMQSFQRWCEAWSGEGLRVLKPGGHLLAFGGARTWHRLAAGLEDAGFEIRDSIAWLYGSGFPKSLDVSKAIDKAAGADREVLSERPAYGIGGNGILGGHADGATAQVTAPATDAAKQWQGWGTALKPAFEPIVVARKTLQGTVSANVLAHGTGGLNIDACRVGSDERTNPAGSASSLQRVSRVKHGYRDNLTASVGEPSITVGRWPTNVVLDDSQAAELDKQSGTLTSGANPTRRGSDKFRNAYGDFAGQEDCVAHRGVDSGGAARFFPTFRYTAKAPRAERPSADGTSHPTVKPVELMAWLIRLVTPPPGNSARPVRGQRHHAGSRATGRKTRYRYRTRPRLYRAHSRPPQPRTTRLRLRGR